VSLDGAPGGHALPGRGLGANLLGTEPAALPRRTLAPEIGGSAGPKNPFDCIDRPADSRFVNLLPHRLQGGAGQGVRIAPAEWSPSGEDFREGQVSATFKAPKANRFHPLAICRDRPMPQSAIRCGVKRPFSLPGRTMGFLPINLRPHFFLPVSLFQHVGTPKQRSAVARV
jgi:hypothetical protein